MRVAAPAILVASLFFACGGTAESNGDPTGTSSSAIVGGAVDSGDSAVVNFQTLYQDTYAQCTAEFISPTLLLTAAHCVTPANGPGTPIGHAIIVGTQPTNGQTISVPDSDIHVGPSFNASSGASDIAVIVMSEPISGITPLGVNTKPVDPSTYGSSVLIVGYGLTSPTGVASANELTAKRSATTKLQGLEGPAQGLASDKLMIGDQSAAACEGDSGGPAIMNIDGAQAIIGISSERPSQSCEGAELYTPVNEYIPFIEQYGPITTEVSFAAAIDAGIVGDARATSETPPAATNPPAQSSCAIAPLSLDDSLASPLAFLALGVTFAFRRKRSENS